MLVLAAADTLAGGASAASELTCTVFGMELNAGNEVYKVLDQRQLAVSPATIYTVPSSTTAFIKTITVVNTNATTARSFQMFRGGTTSAYAISPAFVIPAGGSAIYEDGLGWSVSEIMPGSTLVAPVFSSYFDWEASSLPSAPTADVLRMFARKTSGRMLPKWVGPSGVDTWMQPALFGNNVVQYNPTAGTTATGGFGVLWAKGGSSGTVDTPVPSGTSPAIINQMKRTRHRNVVTTADQAMGIIATAANLPWVWRGNAAGLGGWFFFTRFVIELWPGDSCRLFVGLTPGTTEQVTTNTFQNNTIGLWHDATMGANVLYLATKDGSTYNGGSAISGATLAAGQGYDFYMFAKPNDNTVYYRLDDINAGTTLIDSSVGTNLPTDSVFLGPQVEMSNGASFVTANTVGIGINRIYVESDH
jgi:hypothetical protein